MKNLLYKHLIEPKSIDFMNKLCRALCFNKVNKKKITKKVALQLLDKWSYGYNKKRY